MLLSVWLCFLTRVKKKVYIKVTAACLPRYMLSYIIFFSLLTQCWIDSFSFKHKISPLIFFSFLFFIWFLICIWSMSLYINVRRVCVLEFVCFEHRRRRDRKNRFFEAYEHNMFLYVCVFVWRTTEKATSMTTTTTLSLRQRKFSLPLP